MRIAAPTVAEWGDRSTSPWVFPGDLRQPGAQPSRVNLGGGGQDREQEGGAKDLNSELITAWQRAAETGLR